MVAVPILLSASVAHAAATTGTLIQCPDWQRYAPPVVSATAADGQTRTTFDARTRTTAAPRTPSAPTRTTTCTHRITQGDTLGRIAAVHLGTSARWREIASANPGMDPNRLTVGATINLPCGQPTGGQQVEAAVAAPLAGTTWLARMFGAATPAKLDSAAPADPEVTPPAAATAPVDPPLPVWSARQGEYLSDILKRWGGEAGWQVIVDTNDAWQLAVSLRMHASFEDAVAELVRGLAHDGTPPRVRLHPNKVLRLGGPL